MSVYTGLTESQAAAIQPPKHLLRSGGLVTVYTGPDAVLPPPEWEPGGSVVEFAAWSPALDGATDSTAKFLDACAEATGRGLPLLLPPGPIAIAQTAVVDRIIGAPGQSKIVLLPDFTKTGYGNQFCFMNTAFTTGNRQYDEATASYVHYSGFEIETTPNVARSIFGLSNVRGGNIYNVGVTVNRRLVGGVPIKSDALIDMYSCVKRVTIRKCRLRNITGAYGASKTAEGGGGCIWIRNFRSGTGTVLDDATEGNVVIDNDIEHWTSDEAIAIYGVRGLTSNNRVVLNRIKGLSSVADGGPYRSGLLSIFPLADGSAAGPTAAVTGNAIECNSIQDDSWLYNVIRIGNTPDAARECWGNVSRGNHIVANRSSDATAGPQATWVAAGSPGSDPSATCAVVRCIEGTNGSAYYGNFSGNASIDDIVFVPNGGAQANAGIYGFQRVISPTVRGNVYNGLLSCRNVESPAVEAFARAFTNCNLVTGGEASITGSTATYAVAYYDSGSASSFALRGTRVSGGGALVNVTSSVHASSIVTISGVSGSRSGATTAALIHNSTCVVTARDNALTGTIAAPAAGTGTVTRAGNYWAGTTD